jgi:hypothetical protein
VPKSPYNICESKDVSIFSFATQILEKRIFFEIANINHHFIVPCVHIFLKSIKAIEANLRNNEVIKHYFQQKIRAMKR